MSDSQKSTVPVFCGNGFSGQSPRVVLFFISEYLEGTSSSFCLQAFPCIWPCYKQQMRERSVLSKPCSALQFLQRWAACLAGSGADITTWHSAREHDLCHTVKARSSHASFIYCITEPMRQKLILRK